MYLYTCFYTCVSSEPAQYDGWLRKRVRLRKSSFLRNRLLRKWRARASPRSRGRQERVSAAAEGLEGLREALRKASRAALMGIQRIYIYR